MKRRLLVAGALVVACAVGVAGLNARWTRTDHGPLDWRAAWSLHLLTFDYTFQPDPRADFEITLPINLVYPLSMALPYERVAKVEDVEIPDGDRRIAARVYWPGEPARGEAPPPVIVYYHGGGFTVGSVETFEELARSLANATGAIVVSVEYRLAPVDPYPAAADDAYAAAVWAAAAAAELGGDPASLFVCGDSAGGNLAAVTALRARDLGAPALAGQLLYYPGTDFVRRDYESMRTFVDGYGLSSEGANAFQEAYAGHVADKSDPYLSPLRAKSHAGLPPALVVTAGFDPLTDAASLYAERLSDAGVRVEHDHYPTVFHGFMSIRFFPQRRAALERTGEFVRGVVAAGDAAGLGG